MSFAASHIINKFIQGGLPDTVNTLVTISQPAGGHHLAADQKIGEVPTRRKQALFSSWQSAAGKKCTAYNGLYELLLNRK
jgi:hypothetical protein